MENLKLLKSQISFPVIDKHCLSKHQFLLCEDIQDGELTEADIPSGKRCYKLNIGYLVFSSC
jgi:hypothetical protein